MKVLHVIASVEVGGAERMLLELVRGQVSRGHDVTVASSGGSLEPVFRRAGARMVHVPLQKRSMLATARASAILVRLGLQPDVVHAHNVRAAIAARVGVSPFRRHVARVATEHGVSPGDARLSRVLLCLVADAVVAVSRAGALQLQGGWRRVPIHVIRNAVPPPVSRDRVEARRRLGIDAHIPVALCLARLAPEKRHDLLLHAWSQVSAPALLLCAGQGHLLDKLKRHAVTLGIEDRVRFLELRSDVDWLLAATDLLTLASEAEGLPLAVLEALAAGVPVVATDVGGLAEVVVSGSGLLVPPGDAAALGGALSLMLEDPVRRRSASDVARSQRARLCSPESVVSSYDDLYNRLLDRPPPVHQDG